MTRCADRKVPWPSLRGTAAGVLVALVAAAALPACSKDAAGPSSAPAMTFDGMMKKIVGPSAKDRVAMAFDPNDADRRREGVLGLSKHDWGLKEPYLKGYDALLRTDKEPLVRAAAARALGKAKDPTYLPSVAKALYDPAEPVRVDSAIALDSLTGEQAVEALRNRAVLDDSQDVRAAAAKALRHYRREDVVRTLMECLTDKAFSVRHQAHASLVEIVGQDLGYQPADWSAVAGRPLAGPPKPASWWDRMWQRSETPRKPESPPAAAATSKPVPAAAPPGTASKLAR
jgi:hypothetical protein